MKTIKQHFKKLPILYRELAMGYASKEERLNWRAEALHTAVCLGIDWSGTREGTDFWYAVYINAYYIGQKKKPNRLG